MKKKKTTNNTSNTEGGQIVNNNAPIQNQFNIQNFNGDVSDKSGNVSKIQNTGIEPIKRAIAQSDTDKVFLLLMGFLEKKHPDNIDDAVLIESRWQYLKKEKYRGVIDDDMFIKEKNRVHESVIRFLNDL